MTNEEKKTKKKKKRHRMLPCKSTTALRCKCSNVSKMTKTLPTITTVLCSIIRIKVCKKVTQPSVKKGEQERNASSGSIKMDLMIGAIAITQRAHNIRNENTTNFINCHSLQLHHIIYCQSLHIKSR